MTHADYTDAAHSDGAPAIEGTGLRVKDVASTYEHSENEPDKITETHPRPSGCENLTLGPSLACLR
jgi:hypothetical protein